MFVGAYSTLDQDVHHVHPLLNDASCLVCKVWGLVNVFEGLLKLFKGLAGLKTS